MNIRSTMLHSASMAFALLVFPSWAADISFSGHLEADVASHFDDSWNPHNASNHDLSLTSRLEFEQKTALEVYTHIATTTVDPKDSSSRIQSYVRNPDRATWVDDGDGRWTSLDYDGFTFFWEFSSQAYLVLGDLVYQAGATSYYPYHSTRDYASIMSDVTLRGIGLQLGKEGQLYFGAPEENDQAFWGFASYRFALVDRSNKKVSFRPLGDLVFKNGGRDRRWTLGTEFLYSSSGESATYGMNGAAAIIPFHGGHTYTLMAEPFFNYGKFSLTGSFYQAFLADADSALDLQTSMPVQRFAMLEPSIQVHPKVAIGLAGEFQDLDDEMSDNEFFAATPNLYVYPTQEVSLTFWTSYRWYHNAHDRMSIGISAEANF